MGECQAVACRAARSVAIACVIAAVGGVGAAQEVVLRELLVGVGGETRVRHRTRTAPAARR